MKRLTKKERQGEFQFAKTEVPPPLNANVFYLFESHPIYDQTQGSSVVFLTLWIVLLYMFNDQTVLQSHMNQLWVYIMMVFFWQWVIQLAYLQIHYEISPPQIRITSFTLFYIYIVLHSHVKSYKCIYISIYIVLSDCIKLYKYVYFYTNTEYKSETIYKQTLGSTGTGICQNILL